MSGFFGFVETAVQFAAARRDQHVVDVERFFQRCGNLSPTRFLAESIGSIVRTNKRVPVGTVMVLTLVERRLLSESRSDLLAKPPESLGGSANSRLRPDSRESNRRAETSATSYCWTLAPTRKLIWFSLPPTYVPLITLPFFNSSVSASAAEASMPAQSNRIPQCSFFIAHTSLLAVL